MAKLRADRQLSQKDLAREMTVMLDISKPVSPVTISSYELGSKAPKLEALVFFATFFGVSVDYLLCLEDKVSYSTIERKDDSPIVEPNTLIKPQRWKEYHNMPVYIVFADVRNQNRWGVLDYNKRRIVTTEQIVPLTTELTLYCYPPVDSYYKDVSGQQPLDMTQLMNTSEQVWIEMLNSDPYVKGKYNGWYVHNRDKSMLINMGTGLVLPYTGCGISFNAYKG